MYRQYAGRWAPGLGPGLAGVGGMLCRVLRRLLVVSLIVGGLASAWVFWIFWVAGQFKRLEPHFAGSCVPVRGIVGAEDITIHPRTGVAYISAYDRRAVQAGRPGGGAIYAYDLNLSSPALVKLTPDAAADFRPHGISLYVSDAGTDRIFVVNHAAGRHTIEIYEVAGEELRHRDTLSDPLLVSPNDILAVGPDRFYVTNDHGNAAGLGRTLEEYLRLPLANVLFYDGSRFTEVASGVRMANGINVSPDGGTVYVGSTIGREVKVYRRDPGTGFLQLREDIPLGTGVDNIEVDAEGTLWIGAHPRLLDFVAHAGDPTRFAPSQVLRVARRADGTWAVDEVFLDLGDELSASSVAAVLGSRLLIGPVLDPRFLDCRFD